MAYHRPGKTYPSAIQKAEMEAPVKAANEIKNQRTRPRRLRRPPPRFSDLFIKKKKEEEKSLELSKENVDILAIGTKVSIVHLCMYCIKKVNE